MSNEKKWYQRPTTIIYIFISVIFGVYYVVTSYYQSVEMGQIHHRLDVRDAYFNKGLIDGAKEREKGYFEERERNLAILEFCKENDCNLPLHLRRELPQKNFTPIETVLMGQFKEK